MSGSGVNRRKFLALSGATAAAAAAAGFGGQYLLDRRFPAPPPAPEVHIEPVGSLPRGVALTDIPGLSPFFTPNSQFYRVDTAGPVPPKVAASSWQLRIHGMVDNPMTVSFDQLVRMPMEENDITLTCVAESVGGGYVGNAHWQGTLLAPLLRKAGVQKGANQIVMRDVKGMNLGVATDPVLDGRPSMLAIGMNGSALPAEHGFPVRVVVPGLYGYVSACKWVVDMELTTFSAFDSYWVKQRWAQQAPIKTESRIDTPKTGTTLTAGKTVMIAGVAWAQTRGIEAVEVSVDGTWHLATLASQDTIDTWRQWYYPWQPTAGKHTIQARATDKTGYTQTATIRPVLPNGATGYPTTMVQVN
jgi:DMSO/TMAO reductase YedYZ molybdopterin-dependent catalytic subunit